MNPEHTLVFTALLLVMPVAWSGDIATERTQAATLGVITTLQTATSKIQETVDRINTLENTAGELVRDIPGMVERIPGVEDVFVLMREIESVIEAGTDLAYSSDNLETFMLDRFQTYDDYLQAIIDDGGIIRASFETRFKDWNSGHRDAIRSIMKAHGIHSDALATEETRLQTLASLSSESEGRMQAAQIGHQIAIEEVKQIHKLRELMMEQNNLHASYFATKQAMDAEREATTEYITRRRQVVDVTDGKAYP